MFKNTPANRSILSIIGIIIGITAILMLFFIPLIGIYLFPNIFNSTGFCITYFILFLLLTFTANISLEISNQPIDVDEIRDEKLDKLLKSK